MIIDAAVEVLARVQQRRRLAQLTAAGSVTAALLAPILAPDLFGQSLYVLGVIAVIAAAGLTDLACTLAAAALVLAAGCALDFRLGARPVDIAVRAALFVLTTVLTGMGAEAFRRFHRQAMTAEADLRKSEALTRTLLETGPDAMLFIDAAGAVVRFSRAGEALFGWSADDVVGRNVTMLLRPPYHGGHDQYIGKSREVTGRRKDGSHFPMMLHVVALRIEEERYFAAFIHDLTELRAANDRTQDLRAQLAHIWSMRSLGELASVMAHELNQPLSALVNYLRGARRISMRLELADSELLYALDKAGDQAIRAGEIIRRMRDMVSRSAADPRPEGLSAMITEIDFMTQLIAREGGATVRYDLAEENDYVLADRIQIQQVTTNLVRNAVEAMRETRWRLLTISTRHEPPWWIVRVEDSGPGVPAETVEQLFEPLQSGKSQGMGLGLSISRTIVESHSGQIWVENSLLGGAAFCFRLPEAPDHPAWREDSGCSRQSSSSTTTSLRVTR
jgi:two-component system sensor kinase FixL